MEEGKEPISEIGEFGLVERFKERIGSPPAGEIWSGDDTAVVTAADRVLFTTDVLVEHVDFDLAYASGEDIGWKALAVNVSDIAAMGGAALSAVATLCTPPQTELRLADGIVDGLLAAAYRYGVDIVGGDVSEARSLSVSVALLGRAPESGPVLRSGAKPGDLLAVTGSLGGAAGGLKALRTGLVGMGLEPLIWRQLRPNARQEEGIELARAGATAMIDISDGLAADLAHLIVSSACGCEVDSGAVPIDPGLARLVELDSEVDPRALAVSGGEDFELLVALPPTELDAAREALSGLGTSFTVIGQVTEGPPTLDGRSLEEWKDKGWEHLRNR
jgi:thiamine-monophosphate kinase